MLTDLKLVISYTFILMFLHLSIAVTKFKFEILHLLVRVLMVLYRMKVSEFQLWLWPKFFLVICFTVRFIAIIRVTKHIGSSPCWS